jgi:streptogramin lyase
MISLRVLSLLVLCAGALPAAAQNSLFVTSRFTDQVLHYDGASGAFLGVFASGGGLDNPVGLTFGPDGHLYVASGDTDQVLRYDGASGTFLGVFASGGGLDGARQVNFGPDGSLYVASGATNAILRYDGRTGAFQGVFASGGNLQGPTSFCFGPRGDLFVVSVLNDRIKRYDGRTGAYLGNFVTTAVDGPHDLSFGPDGMLYVSNAFSPRIFRFDGVSGASGGLFVFDPLLSAALGLCWDEQGDLYVVNQGRNEVRRYDGTSGAFLDARVAPGSGGLSAPLFAVFEPSAGLRVRDPLPGLAGASNLFVLSGATPGSQLWFGAGDRAAAWVPPGCSGRVGLPSSFARRTLLADESGRAFLSLDVPPTLAGRRLVLRVIEPALCAASAMTGFRF